MVRLCRARAANLRAGAHRAHSPGLTGLSERMGKGETGRVTTEK